MAETSRLFTTSGSPLGGGSDQVTGYSAAQLQELFRMWLFGSDGGGVLKGRLNAYATTGGTSPVSVASGVSGAYGIFHLNDAALNVTVPTPVTLTRIDRIIIRVNMTNTTSGGVPGYTARIVRLAGTEGGVAPALTQNANIWEIPLYTASITTGGAITLTDERAYATTPMAPANVDGATLEVAAGVLRAKDGGITQPKMAANSVNTASLIDANVTTPKIADANVTTAKIADNNVTDAKINGVAGSKVTGSVPNATNAATAAAVGANGVDTAAIQANAVTTAKIADNNVTTAKIADNNVTDAKIASVSGGKVSGAVASATSATSATTATSATNATNAVNADKVKNNGTAHIIQTGQITVTASGSITDTWAKSTVVGSFPVAFSAVPRMILSAVAGSTNGAAYTIPGGAAESGGLGITASGWNGFIAFYVKGNITNPSITFDYIAIGPS